ncbi:MAG TPA: hypothetical protein VI306_11520 [Pyrinomonadaceae bacterium]
MIIDEQEELEEVGQWLKEHWQDRVFNPPSVLKGGDYAGAYTLYCSIVKCDEQEYILKRYNPLGVYGAEAEKLNYSLFGKHSLFPRLEAFVPKGTDSPGIMAYGILLSFYPHKISLDGISIVEALAIGLSMATMLSYFAEQGRIYFDLRSDSLRVDSAGGLHLIDFSDLITMDELLERPSAGLPVIDRKSKLIPPEGIRHQNAVEEFFDGKSSWELVREVAHAMNPQRYQVFALAGLLVEILVGPGADAAALSARIARAGGPGDGAFTVAERTQFLDLLTRMQEANDMARPSFQATREVFWSLLSPRLKPKLLTTNVISRRAAKLLRTISRRDGDTVSQQIKKRLMAYWSTY